MGSSLLALVVVSSAVVATMAADTAVDVLALCQTVISLGITLEIKKS
jgi:hypothetical protein